MIQASYWPHRVTWQVPAIVGEWNRGRIETLARNIWVASKHADMAVSKGRFTPDVLHTATCRHIIVCPALTLYPFNLKVAPMVAVLFVTLMGVS